MNNEKETTQEIQEFGTVFNNEKETQEAGKETLVIFNEQEKRGKK